jgi:polyphosphate glucokinase
VRLADKVTIITGGDGGMGRVAAERSAAPGTKEVVAEVVAEPDEAAAVATVDAVRPTQPDTTSPPPSTLAIGIDVGGTGIKGAVVDVSSGTLASERIRVLTPQPSTPQACIRVIARIVARLGKAHPEAATIPVGVGIPAVVTDGIVRSAANIDRGWIDFDADRALERLLKRPVHVVNDADAAGTAEMRFGAGVGRLGTVIVLTLGTGVGSAIYVDGTLVPNTELGHLEVSGREAEKRSSANARTRRGQSWKAWAEDLDEHLNAINMLFSPRLLIIGGGVSKNGDRFIPRLTVPTEVVAAAMRNEAGIIGAAIVAADRTHDRSAAPA